MGAYSVGCLWKVERLKCHPETLWKASEITYLDLREVVENQLEFVMEALLGELHLAHVERTDARDLVVPVHDWRKRKRLVRLRRPWKWLIKLNKEANQDDQLN